MNDLNSTFLLQFYETQHEAEIIWFMGNRQDLNMTDFSQYSLYMPVSGERVGILEIGRLIWILHFYYNLLKHSLIWIFFVFMEIEIFDQDLTLS